jgi:hypothetical protein
VSGRDSRAIGGVSRSSPRRRPPWLAAAAATGILLAVAGVSRAREVIVRGSAIAPDAPGAAPTPTPVPLPGAVADRLAWAKQTLPPTALARLDRAGGDLAAAMAAGTPFPVVRARAQRQVASMLPGLDRTEIAAASLVVMAMRASSLDADLRRMSDELGAMASAEKRLDEASAQLRSQLARTGTRRGTGGTSAWRSAASMRAAALERAITPWARLRYAKAPTVPQVPPADALVTTAELETLLRESDARRSAIQRETRVARERLALYERRWSKFVDALSVAMTGTTPSTTLARDLR